MKRIFLMLLVIGVGLKGASAQEPQKKDSGLGYVFIAPGAFTRGPANLQFGGGGEWIHSSGIGVGGEAGYLSTLRYLDRGIGVVSINGLYMFNKSGPNRVKPFLTGGYSLVLGEEFGSAINFGAGVHYWFSKRVGMRFEFRDHVPPAFPESHYLSGRIGIEFR